MKELEQAWAWRDQRGLFEESEALRVFHGPGEGISESKYLAIDRFADHYWITFWDEVSAKLVERVIEFYRERGADSIVGLWRPKKGVPDEPRVFFGKPPEEALVVREYGARFNIRLTGARHPGLFLDHLDLRIWLANRSSGWRVLNLFAYTGSLSVASALGGASHVTTIDLSKPTIKWAAENWAINGLAESRADFIAGDIFEWLPRFRKGGKKFDCVIVDPPSFARGKKGDFSTARDLPHLHQLCMEVLAPGGVLVTSINSAQLSRAKFETDVLSAARASKREFEVLSNLDLPETFPTPLGDSTARYLKGWILRNRV